MTTRDIRGRRLALPVLLLLPLLGAPVSAMTLDDYGSPYTSAGEVQAAQKILQGADWRFLNELKKELKG